MGNFKGGGWGEGEEDANKITILREAGNKLPANCNFMWLSY